MKKFIKLIIFLILFVSLDSISYLKAEETSGLLLYQNVVDDNGEIVTDNNIKYRENNRIHFDIVIENKTDIIQENVKIYSNIFNIYQNKNNYISIDFDGVYVGGRNVQTDYSIDDSGLIVNKIEIYEKIDVKFDVIINSIPDGIDSFISVFSNNVDEVKAQSVCSNTQSTCAVKYLHLDNTNTEYYTGQDLKISDFTVSSDELNSFSSYDISYNVTNTSDTDIINAVIQDGIINKVDADLSNLTIVDENNQPLTGLKSYDIFGVVVPNIKSDQEIKISYNLNTNQLSDDKFETLITVGNEKIGDDSICNDSVNCQKVDIKTSEDKAYSESKYIDINLQLKNENWNTKLNMTEITDNKTLNLQVVIQNMDVDTQNAILIRNNLNDMNGVTPIIYDAYDKEKSDINYNLNSDGLVIYELKSQETAILNYQIKIDTSLLSDEFINIVFTDDQSSPFKLICSGNNCSELKLENGVYNGITKTFILFMGLLFLVILDVVVIILGVLQKRRL